jgi:hypothetical protein
LIFELELVEIKDAPAQPELRTPIPIGATRNRRSPRVRARKPPIRVAGRRRPPHPVSTEGRVPPPRSGSTPPERLSPRNFPVVCSPAAPLALPARHCRSN